MKRTTSKGINAVAWFAGQSFHGQIEPPAEDQKPTCEHGYFDPLDCARCQGRCPCGTNGDHYCPSDVARD